jgi:hypothetical protein
MLVSPVSGAYAEDQLLTVEMALPGFGVHYSFRDQSGAEGPWIPLRGPLRLSAAPGEQRDYRLTIRADIPAAGEGERRELSYRIDRRIPRAPRVLPGAGTYWDPVAVRFEASPGDKVFYSVQGDVVRNPAAWDGTDVQIGEQDRRAEYAVQAYTVSAAGGRSRIVTAKYILDTRAPVLDVLSPVSGNFANPQAIALTFRNLLWVRYTLDGTDPAIHGTPYAGPVTIDGKGTVTVKVAGMPRAAKRPLLRREVTVTCAPPEGPGVRLSTDNGSYPSGISPVVLSSPGGSLYYTLWEKTPSESDQLASKQVSVSSRTGGPYPVTLRLRALSDSGRWGPEYRYFYFVGPGAPAAPTLTLDTDEPVQAPARAQVAAPEDTLVSVSLGSQKPDPAQPAVSTWVDVVPTAGARALVVRAVAMDGAGVLSAVMERRLSMSADAGTEPAFTFAPGTVQGTGLLSAGQAAKDAAGKPAGTLVYELTSDGSDPVTPGPDSPVLAAPVQVTVPFGMSRTFKARVAVLDDFGGALSVSGVASLVIDRTPPDEPQVGRAAGSTLDEPTVVPFSSKGKVFFSLTADGSMPPDPNPASSPSNTFIALPGIEGSTVTYRLKLLAVDSAGNSTEVYGPLVYTVDLEPPVIPAITGIADGGRYASRQVSPLLQGDHAWTVRYTASSDGSEPPEPDLKSPELTSAAVFSGEDGAETHWRLKLLAISHNGKRVGERRSLSFIIDLQPPDVPRLAGLPAEGRVARPVALTAEPAAPDTRVLYSMSVDGSEPSDPLVSGSPFPAVLRLDTADGTRKDFIIRVAAMDGAGNKSLSDRRYQVTVDRELPADPVVHGAEEGATSTRAVTLTMESGQPLTVFEMTDDGSVPRMPTPASRAYSGQLVLAGKAGASVTYRILPRAFNDLGTASRAASMFSVTVDRSVPAAPPQPRVLFSGANPGVAYLIWPSPETGRFLYRLEAGSQAGSGAASPPDSSTTSAGSDFTPVNGPLSVTVDPQNGSTIRGAAVFESAAGARSEPTAFSLLIGKRLLPPIFRGARDGAPTTQAIQLSCGSPEGEVRYETSTDGSFPPEVTASSPPFPQVLMLDAADGQTVEVTIAARAFDPSGRSIPSEEVTFRADIDKTPPDAPAASGMEDGGHYQDTRTVSLLSVEGTIYDTVSTSADPLLPAQTEANKYSLPLVLDAEPGRSVTYHVMAFSVDPAGNRSREIRSWTVTIDRKIVYASPDGNDYSDGSRDTPVRSIGRAVQIAQATSRKTIFAAAGQYPQESRIDLAEDLVLVGGLDPRTWEPLGLERWSSIAPAEKWKSGDTLLAMTAGSVSITGFELAAGPTALDSLLSVSGGSLSLLRGAVALGAGGSGRAIFQSGGTLSILDFGMQASSGWKGSFIAASGGRLAISGSHLAGPQASPDFAAVDVRDVVGLEVKGTTIDPGSGQRTRGLRAVSSSVTIIGSTVVSGAGTIEAAAIDGQASTISVDNSDVAASSSARFPAAVLSTGGSLRVSRSRISLAGASSVVGVNARNGDVVLLRNTIKAAGTREYLALVRLEDARALIADNLLIGAAAGESVVLQVRGGSTDILNNTILAGTGTSITAAILLQGDSMPRIVNNVVSRSGPAFGSAVSVLDAHALFATGSAAGTVMLSNSFGGWKRIVHVEYARTQSASPLEIGTVDTLNRVDGEPFGGPISGNLPEEPGASFKPGTDSYLLARASVCVDAGTDLASANGPAGTGGVLILSGAEISADLVGNPRPGPLPLTVPGPPRGWDIGAYEYVE